jgi:hypothetical protein
MDKRGPAPTIGTGTTIGVRCDDEFLAEIDAWRERQSVVPARPAALRYLAQIGLRALKLAAPRNQ